jgi:hypothetical protein
MPIGPGSFAFQKLLPPTNNYRAWAQVVLINGSSQYTIARCLVDTGSDYTILPLAAARAIGITPSASVALQTAAGTTTSLVVHPSLDLQVEGWLLSGTRVAFSPAPGFTPVVGRIELMSAFDFGFDQRAWYHD